MLYNLPNFLTFLRILAIPLFVGIFYFPHTWLLPANQNLIATLIFAGAAITRMGKDGCGGCEKQIEKTKEAE